MDLTHIINNWNEDYNPEAEQGIIKIIKELKLVSLTGQVADLLALAIIDHYNNLAKTILEKEYSGKKINIVDLNEFLIKRSEEKTGFLHYSARFGNKEMLIYFLEHKLEVKGDMNLMTPLHFLCFAEKLKEQDFIELIEILETQSPGIITKKDKYNLTAMHYAAHYKNEEFLKALVKANNTKH